MTNQQEKLHLTIRCALETFSDYQIECASDWTVLNLKEHLTQICDFKPEVSRQRLIYAGRCLENEQKIIDVLKLHRDGIQRGPDEQLEKQVIHLVYIGGLEAGQKSNGLRHRAAAANNTNSAYIPNAGSPNLGEAPPMMANLNMPMPQYYDAAQQPQSHEAWMMAYQNYMAQMMHFYPHQQGMMASFNQPMFNHYANPQWNMMQMQQFAQHVPAANQQLFFGPTAGPFVGQQIPIAAMVQAQQQLLPAHQPNEQQNQMQVPAPLGAAAVNHQMHPPPDFLDLIYKSIRFALLAMVLYLYSSLERFFFVIFILTIFWFVHARRGQRRNQQQNNGGGVNGAAPALAEVQQQEAAQPNPQDQNQPADNGEVAAPNQNGTDQPVNNTPSANAMGAWSIFFQTIQSFFTSLIPENVAPLDIN